VREKIEATGIEPAFSPPEQVAEMIRTDYVHWGTIIKNAGIKAD
jgi:tripartite-type tricarboxylate transporter receptor subunit TctC